MALAAHPDLAWQLAVERLGMGWSEFRRICTVELAWRLWGERRRRNHRARMIAWALSIVVSPHIQKKDQSKVSPRRLFLAAAGRDLDRDEME